MVTICGGKWTTYRHMAEDCVNHAATLARLADRPCVTDHLNIHGFHPSAARFGRLAVYGSDAPAMQQLMDTDPALSEPLHSALPYVARRSGVGRSRGNGAHGGRRCGPPHARPVPERPRRHRDGAPSGRA